MYEKLGLALGAVVVGVLGAVALFWLLNKACELLPKKWELRLKPYALLLPAYAAIGIFLLYPAVETVTSSFRRGRNGRLLEFVGFDNYSRLFSDPRFLNTLINNVLWIIVAPAAIVAAGLLVAVLVDKLKPMAEKTAKSIIFLPMAISMVGASTIWNLVYAWRPEGSSQVGLLNQIVVSLGGSPQTWLQMDTARFNTFLLMAVYIWTQVGFAMVLLSAALKGVPEDTIEAGRIDGASEGAIFWRIILPQAWPTVITVFITVLIGVMKIFDIVYAMTNGNYNTNVLGNAFYASLFRNGDPGTASAIVVILIIAIIPVLVYQVRQFRLQEANS
ncbi:carbohydrate ABC transporter permease [Tessaracoccus sp. Z1128]